MSRHIMFNTKCRIFDQHRPSGLFVAPLVALLSMWLFSGVTLFFLRTCEQRDNNLDVVPVCWGVGGIYIFFF